MRQKIFAVTLAALCSMIAAVTAAAERATAGTGAVAFPARAAGLDMRQHYCFGGYAYWRDANGQSKMYCKPFK